MNTNKIGQETREKQIGAWLQAVNKNTDLLLAFPVNPIEHTAIAEFRQRVAEKIGWLASYLATNQWNLFAAEAIGDPLTIEADIRHAAERAEEPHDKAADEELADAMDKAHAAEAEEEKPEQQKKAKKARKPRPAVGFEAGVSMAEIEAAEAAGVPAKQVEE